jgi:hypothetical protein
MERFDPNKIPLSLKKENKLRASCNEAKWGEREREREREIGARNVR